MSSSCLDMMRISGYVRRTVELEDAMRVERHVRACPKCRDKLVRMKRYSEALFDDYPGHGPAAADCPTPILLEHYGRESLSERQMLRLQEHLLSCHVCALRVAQHAHAPRGPVASAASQQRTLELHSTRQADIDVRFAVEGLRVAHGSECVEWGALASLSQRLQLTDLSLSTRHTTSERQVEFALERHPRVRGQLRLLSPEGFRLRVEVPAPPETAGAAHGPLSLWSRTRVWLRQAPRTGTWNIESLLPPGHYFVGPSEFKRPWLAFSVEQDLLTPLELAEIGYDHCLHGRFRRAIACLESACAQVAHGHSLRHVLENVREFAMRYDLHERDRTLLWRSDDERVRPGAAAQPRDGAATDHAVSHDALPEPPLLDVETFSLDDLDKLTHLVQVLSARAQMPRVPRAGEDVLVLSRRHFRTRYGTMMRHVRGTIENMKEEESNSDCCAN